MDPLIEAFDAVLSHGITLRRRAAPRRGDDAIAAVRFPDAMVTRRVPTMVPRG